MKKRLGIIWFSFLFGWMVPTGIMGQVFSDEALKFSQVINWIDKYYVDTVNKSELVEKAIVEMLQNLDPHSTYLTKEEVKAMSEPLQGNFEGIGISFNILNDTIFVINPIPNGPSEKVGIRAGDRIVKIEGQPVAGVGIKTSDVYAKLRGKKGTRVSVSISRRSVSELLDFTITRDKIPIYSLDASYMIDDDMGYIKLNRFAYTTMDEFRMALGELKGQGMKDLILDLGGNGGGYMDVAIKLADQFLDDRKIIVYTEGNSHPRRKFYSSSRGDFLDGRVVIIIDQGSASASEIVAGAVQDWDRGVIVGRRSFGKGLVQNPMLLLDSSMLRLTIARYYTPTGRLIQKPYEDGFEEYSKDLINRYNAGELLHSDSIVFPESLKYQTLVTRRPVYGGGGIMPDYFVPLDTTYNSEYYNRLLNRGIINFFTLSYVDDHRVELHAKYPTFQSFLVGFTISDKILEDLTTYASEEDLAFSEEDFNVSREHIRLVLKSYIARDLWSTSEFYQVYNTNNPSVLKAIEVLEGQDIYQALLQSKQ
ncbi:MAG: peptidase S41 [Bacteroides sp. SM1_62]|nr:MAG: peptidase S41 [Bacteroides sp. SM23_62]KPL24266.1 MAG: peptidase S41 [Bacteroides sp. SM1_62]